MSPIKREMGGKLMKLYIISFSTKTKCIILFFKILPFVSNKINKELMYFPLHFFSLHLSHFLSNKMRESNFSDFFPLTFVPYNQSYRLIHHANDLDDYHHQDLAINWITSTYWRLISIASVLLKNAVRNLVVFC
jgi:hypothetical protein